MTVHLFGATSSPSVANFCLKRTAEIHKKEFSSEAVDSLLRSFYMDDLLKSTSSTEQASILVQEITELLARGGFRLTKWLSNNRDVLEAIPEEERGKSLASVNISEDPLPQELTLGLQWNAEEDVFTFEVSLPDKPLTRRGLLSVTASLYDPLGFVSPVTLIPKKIQQQLCKMQLDWDDSIPDKLATEFIEWKTNLDELSKIKVRRRFKNFTDNGGSTSPTTSKTQEQRTELHIFCDASETAYGAAAYLKVKQEDKCDVSFVMGKSRVAPVKAVTIPRLELTAAVVAVKMHRFITEEIDLTINQSYFWTDSQVVLRYLLNTSSRFKVFVAHRVQIIQEFSDVSSWNYVPSSLNPADLASRGIQPGDTEKLMLWLKGPEFLQNDSYPDYSQASNDDTDDLEVKRVMVLEVAEHDFTYLLHYFSSYNKLRRSIVWLMRYIKYLKSKEAATKLRGPVTVIEQEAAEVKIIQAIQRAAYPNEIQDLEAGKPVKTASTLSSLCPIYQNGLLKVGGRQPPRHPVILPRHHVTDLIIKQAHVQNGHSGVEHIRAKLSEDYYIMKGYSTVKKVITACFDCKLQHKQPMQQQMAPLPPDRTQVGDAPFTFVGIDYFGPFQVKQGRSTPKRWGCLFTCLVTRAVHIEVAHLLSAESFLLS